MIKTNGLFEQDKYGSEIQAIKKAIKDTKDLRIFQR